MRYKWEKRWKFSNALYCKDFIITEVQSPTHKFDLEKVAVDGVTIKHYGTYSNLEAAKYVAEKEMDKEFDKNGNT